MLNDVKSKGDTMINDKTEQNKRLQLNINKWKNKLNILVISVLQIPETSKNVIDLKKKV